MINCATQTFSSVPRHHLMINAALKNISYNCKLLLHHNQAGIILVYEHKHTLTQKVERLPQTTKKLFKGILLGIHLYCIYNDLFYYKIFCIAI